MFNNIIILNVRINVLINLALLVTENEIHSKTKLNG